MDGKSTHDVSASAAACKQDEIKAFCPLPADRCVSGIIIGCGNRGNVYSSFALDFPERFQVVGIADLREAKRQQFKERFQLPADAVFADWKQFLTRPRMADVAIICTPDALHKEPAVAFAKLGYHILLEKPMAVTESDCREITKACKDNNVTFAVCHVLRYTPCNRKIKELIESGVLGAVVNIQHLEPVGFFHFAHSYVRGNWRNEKESTFSLMGKSCHDLDLLRYWMGDRPVSVSSFGSLSHFNRASKPAAAGSATRCLSCPYEQPCAYSAKKIYLDPIKAGYDGWPVAIIVDTTPDIENVTQALQKGPYGRCVYESDNDVCDNQVVNFQFAHGQTASFTMVAFTERICDRQTRVFGTLGELTVTDGDEIRHFEFLTRTTKVYRPNVENGNADALRRTRLKGHGGADFYLMDSFVRAVARNDPSLILTGPDDALESHLLVFDAEKSRKTHTIVECSSTQPTAAAPASGAKA